MPQLEVVEPRLAQVGVHYFISFISAADVFDQQFRLRGIFAETLAYADDFLIIADSHEDVRRAFDVMDAVGLELGLTWDPEKDIGRDAPCQALEILGVWLDAVTGASQFLTSTIMSEIDIHHVDPHKHPYVLAGRWHTFM